jgi:hypothetical protein
MRDTEPPHTPQGEPHPMKEEREEDNLKVDSNEIRWVGKETIIEHQSGSVAISGNLPFERVIYV